MAEDVALAFWREQLRRGAEDCRTRNEAGKVGKEFGENEQQARRGGEDVRASVGR